MERFKSFLKFLGMWAGYSVFFVGFVFYVVQDPLGGARERLVELGIAVAVLPAMMQWALTVKPVRIPKNEGWLRWRPVMWVIALALLFNGTPHGIQTAADFIIALGVSMYFTFIGWFFMSIRLNNVRP